MLDGVFGIYALGLLPGLLTGGALSDRVGRAVVVLPGALIALARNLDCSSLARRARGSWSGALDVGIGAGLAIGAGTAWAADLRGKSGTVMAGVVLTSGFALGPLFSGLLAQFAAFPLATPFVVSAFLSVGSVTAAAVWSRTLCFRRSRDRHTRSQTGRGALRRKCARRRGALRRKCARRRGALRRKCAALGTSVGAVGVRQRNSLFCDHDGQARRPLLRPSPSGFRGGADSGCWNLGSNRCAPSQLGSSGRHGRRRTGGARITAWSPSAAHTPRSVVHRLRARPRYGLRTVSA